MNQPYSCVQWGSSGQLYIPPIIDVGDLSPFRDLFPENPDGGSAYPITLFIDHNMQIINITHGPINKNDTNLYIDCMLKEIPD